MQRLPTSDPDGDNNDDKDMRSENVVGRNRRIKMRNDDEIEEDIGQGIEDIEEGEGADADEEEEEDLLDEDEENKGEFDDGYDETIQQESLWPRIKFSLIMLLGIIIILGGAFAVGLYISPHATGQETNANENDLGKSKSNTARPTNGITYPAPTKSIIANHPIPKPTQNPTSKPITTSTPVAVTVPPSEIKTDTPTNGEVTAPTPRGNDYSDLVNKLTKGKEKSNEVLNMLWNYYSPIPHKMLNRATLYGFGDETKGDTGIDAKPNNQENFEVISNKIARALVHKEKFIIGGIGSSVMAGHDNCVLDTYQHTMEGMMDAVFKETDSPFEWRNAGETGGCEDNYENQVFNFRNLVGDDIDILHYEWTYYENGQNGIYHEMILRWLLLQPKTPALYIWDCGGYKSDHSLLPPSEVYKDFVKAVLGFDYYAPETKKFIDTYYKYGFNTYMLDRHLSLNGKYPGNVVAGTQGDGMHSTTRKGEKLIGVPGEEAEVKSQGVVYRNWHPGPLGFQAVADAATYYYLRAFNDAIDKIMEAIHQGVDLTQRWPKKPKQLEYSDIPPPQHFIDLKIERSSINSIPRDDSWRNNQGSLPQTGPLSIYQLYYSWLNMKHAPFALSTEDPQFNDPQIFVDATHRWKRTSWGYTNLRPAKDQNRPECKQVDRCGGLLGKGSEMGSIKFMLPPMSIGFIIACFGPVSCSNNFKNIMQNADNYLMKFNDYTIDLSKGILFAQKCIIVQTRFPDGMDEEKKKQVSVFEVGIKDDSCLSISQVMAG